ncbi:MAG: leucine-rich repeat domain-containing protein [Butyrivibrio sp.]|nr:leucine-rich repeat domain-containing protein [Butyrivibrio sp.]
MKKKIAIMILGSLLITTAACGSKKENVSGDGSDNAETVTNEEAAAPQEEGSEELEESKLEDFEYIFQDDGTVAIRAYNGSAAIVNIPEEIDGAKVTSIDGISGDSIVKIVIPDSVTTIEQAACWSNDNLEEVVMGENVTTIGAKAFDLDSALKIINIPDSVTEIGEAAFSCTAIKEVNVPKSLTDMSQGVFSLSSLERVTVPGNVKTIGICAFEDCKDLKEVVIEEGVEMIDEAAFKGNESLARIEIPASVTQMNCKIPEGCTIVAPAGSYAETFANENGCNFEAK